MDRPDFPSGTTMLSAMANTLDAGASVVPMVEIKYPNGKVVGAMLTTGDFYLALAQVFAIAAVSGSHVEVVADTNVNVYDKDDVKRPSQDPEATDALMFSHFYGGELITESLYPYHLDDEGTVLWDKPQTLEPPTDGPASGTIPEIARRIYKTMPEDIENRPLDVEATCLSLLATLGCWVAELTPPQKEDN